MQKSLLIIATTLALGTSACAPAVNAFTNPTGLGISSVCENLGKDTFVTVYLMPTRDGSPWRVEFEGASPEDLSVDCTASHAVLRWKLGQEHRFLGGIKPYRFRLSSGDTHYEGAVTFTTLAQGVGAGGVLRGLVTLR